MKLLWVLATAMTLVAVVVGCSSGSGRRPGGAPGETSPAGATPSGMATAAAPPPPAATTQAMTEALEPVAIAVDPAGNLYIATGSFPSSCRVFKLSEGVLVTVAGAGTCGFSGDGGPATSAEIYSPAAIAFDAAGHMFLADGNCSVREVKDGVITTVAGNGTCGYAGDGGPATKAEIDHPYGLAVDAEGALFISDDFNCRVRVVRGATITTFAGNGTCRFSGDGGPATDAGIEPADLALAPDGTLYIVDSPNGIEQHSPTGHGCRIRSVRSGVINTVAGNGCDSDLFSGDGVPATSVSLWLVSSVAVDAAGNLYIADGYCRVRVVRKGLIETVAGAGWDPATQHDILQTCRYAGEGGPAISAHFEPGSIAVDADGNLYMTAGGYDCRVLRVHNGVISTVAGTGTCPG